MAAVEHVYIYDLPYIARSEFCKIMNFNEKWEELAGTWMQFDMYTIYGLKKKENPTNELLKLWAVYNHSVTELFILLCRMRHYESMAPLLPYVDQKYHILYHNGIAILRRKQHIQVKKNAKVLEISNFNQQPLVDKILNQQMAHLAVNPSNSNNLSVAPPAAFLALPSAQDIDDNGKKINEKLLKMEARLPYTSYNELAIATNEWNQHNILGKGGFGTVYRGTWKNTEVAIKKILRKDPESDESYIFQLQQSLREIKFLKSHAHRNILPLYAYSFDGETPCLVYELMQNGSLEDRLLLRHKSKPLTWMQRHEISKGIACGLQYLHTIGEKPLIHGDIKSANILLDKSFEPKIGDFGLAREGLKKENMKISKIHGTRPYLPEEFLINKKLSIKIDTYSYGIVIFEMATGLRAYDDSRSIKYLRDLIDDWEDKDLSLLMDNNAGEKDNQVYGNFISLGKWCSNRLAQHRPEMEFVFRKLNNL